MQINQNYEKEIFTMIEQLNDIDRYENSEAERLYKTTEKTIESKLFDIIKNKFSHKLSSEFIFSVRKKYFKRSGTVIVQECWNLFCKINSYLHANGIDDKNTLLKEVDDLMQKSERRYILNKEFTQAIYLCNIPEIVELYKKNFPKPPVSIFDADKIPSSLIKEYEETDRIVTEFKNRNTQDNSLEKKVLYIQRHIRAKNRKESEIQRIQGRYFEYSKLPLNQIQEKIEKSMEDANTPYTPQKCTPELADRIMKTADQVTLHSSVKHLTATKHVAAILDGYLLGRENLINTYTSFRPAALSSCDVKDGDGNVICFGPDKIDGNCSSPGTIQLEFDLAKILNPSDFNKNPAIFFKQLDFGYVFNRDQSLNLKTESITINHTGRLRNNNSKLTNLKLYAASGDFYYSELPKYSFISYNTKDIQKIWTLNFFRFLDTLKDAGNSEDATNQINHIYDLISKLSKQELMEFLTDLGKKMSCTAEFNFYGAYKIDLNALQSISLENNEKFSISIFKLCEELNSGNFSSLNKLKTLAPELLKSRRFVEFLLSKISDPSRVHEINELLKN